MVVVPTANEVVIEFRDTWAETLGKLLSLGGVGAFAALGVMRLRKERLNPDGEDAGS
jgi:hypothetical protein